MEANFTSHSLVTVPRWQHHHLPFNRPRPNTPSPAAIKGHNYPPSPISTFPTRRARLRAMNDALRCSATRRTQHDVLRSQSDTFQAPEMLIAPFKLDTNSNMNDQAMLFTPSQAPSITPFVNAHPDRRHESYTNRQQPTSAHQRQQTQHRLFRFSPPDSVEQQQHRWQLSRTATTPPDQHLKKPNLSFEGLVVTPPQQQKLMALELKDTSQRFASQARTTSNPQRQVANQSLPSPRTTPVRQTHSLQNFSPTSLTIEPYSQGKTAESVRAEAAYLNEVAERKRLEQERWQELKRHSERREELRKDETALYRNYSEYLKYFPPGRGEHASPYLMGLLANQHLPAEPTSDLGIAIKYAKQRWENFWVMGDLDYVVRKAKEELEEKLEARKRASSAATAPRKR